MKAVPLRKLQKSWHRLYRGHGDLLRSTLIGALFAFAGIWAAKILLLKMI